MPRPDTIDRQDLDALLNLSRADRSAVLALLAPAERAAILQLARNPRRSSPAGHTIPALNSFSPSVRRILRRALAGNRDAHRLTSATIEALRDILSSRAIATTAHPPIRQP